MNIRSLSVIGITRAPFLVRANPLNAVTTFPAVFFHKLFKLHGPALHAFMTARLFLAVYRAFLIAFCHTLYVILRNLHCQAPGKIGFNHTLSFSPFFKTNTAHFRGELRPPQPHLFGNPPQPPFSYNPPNTIKITCPPPSAIAPCG